MNFTRRTNRLERETRPYLLTARVQPGQLASVSRAGDVDPRRLRCLRTIRRDLADAVTGNRRVFIAAARLSHHMRLVARLAARSLNRAVRRHYVRLVIAVLSTRT
jgi:hypothetical protein